MRSAQDRPDSTAPGLGALGAQAWTPSAGSVTVAPSTADKVGVGVLLVLSGAVLLPLVPLVGSWARDALPWFPLDSLVDLAEWVRDRVTGWGLGAVGALLGAVMGVSAAHDEPEFTVSAGDLVVQERKGRRRFARAQVSRAAVDRGRLVLWDDRGEKLGRFRTGRGKELQQALYRYGWAEPARG